MCGAWAAYCTTLSMEGTPFQHIGHPLLKLQAIINPGYDIKFPPMEEADLLGHNEEVPDQRP